MADVNENDTGSNAVSKQHYAFQDIYHFICSMRYPEDMWGVSEKCGGGCHCKCLRVNAKCLSFGAEFPSDRGGGGCKSKLSTNGGVSGCVDKSLPVAYPQ
jgi:hypothetical protein